MPTLRPLELLPLLPLLPHFPLVPLPANPFRLDSHVSKHPEIGIAPIFRLSRDWLTGWLGWLGFWLQTRLSLLSPELVEKRNWYTQRIKRWMTEMGWNGMKWIRLKMENRTVLRSLGSHYSWKSMCFLLNSLRTLPLRRCVLHCLLSKRCWIPQPLWNFETQISLVVQAVEMKTWHSHGIKDKKRTQDEFLQHACTWL